jgi:hypothetical protein
MRVTKLFFSFLILWFMPFSVLADKQIKSIKVTPMGKNNTRVTFVLTEPFALDLEEDPAQNQVVIRGPEGSIWQATEIPAATGLVKKGEIVTSTQGNQSLFLDVVVGTEIDNYGLKKNFKDRHEFFIDLHGEGVRQVEQKDESTKSVPQEKQTDPIRQAPSAFSIEGEDECLNECDLKADLKALQVSLSLPEDLAYVNPSVIENGDTPKPKLLKAFKIAPSEDPSLAKKEPEVQHVNASNTGRMFNQLQSHLDAQMSAEGTPPDWVIEAKMKEKRIS